MYEPEPYPEFQIPIKVVDALYNEIKVGDIVANICIDPMEGDEEGEVIEITEWDIDDRDETRVREISPCPIVKWEDGSTEIYHTYFDRSEELIIAEDLVKMKYE